MMKAPQKAAVLLCVTLRIAFRSVWIAHIAAHIVQKSVATTTPSAPTTARKQDK
jgi:hypothetical protein